VRSKYLTALALAVLASAIPAPVVHAQAAPCSIIPFMVDSARDEVLSVLSSKGQVIQELRQDLRITQMEQFTPVKVIREGPVCGRVASGFGHDVQPGSRFVVLKLGPIYYARDPDQSRGTGIITDSTFKVLVRLGAAVP